MPADPRTTTLGAIAAEHGTDVHTAATSYPYAPGLGSVPFCPAPPVARRAPIVPLTPDEAGAVVALLERLAGLAERALDAETHGRADLKRGVAKLRRLAEEPSR